LQLERLEDRMAPAVLAVNTTADNITDTSVLTLRDAITLINSGGDPTALGQSSMPAGWASQINTTNPFGSNDAIDFNIPGSGVQTIMPTSVLPTITHPVNINGFSQPGASPNTNSLALGDNALRGIILDGYLITAGDGLTISGGNSTVTGLVFLRFGNAIHLTTIGNNTIQGNGDGGIWVDNVPNNTIGGTTPAARNSWDGINITGTGATGNHVQGNYVGGIGVSGANGNVIQGNYISSILLSDATQTLIGGTTPGAGNVISGPISIFSDNGNPNDGNVIQGNYVGLDPTGTTATGQPGYIAGVTGIFIENSTGNLIGGTTAAARNVVAGFQINIALEENQPGLPPGNNVVEGNYIGTNAAGTAVPLGVPALTTGFAEGVSISSYASGDTIGGTTPGAGNLISGNQDTGIALDLINILVNSFPSGTPANNIVQGNLIGTDVTGTKPIPNGVGMFVNSFNTLIGGTTPGAGNTIAFNNGPGVVVARTGNSIRGNSIFGNAITSESNLFYSNSGLGIELGGDGVTLNDSQGHSGPNNWQNFPFLSAATSSSTSILVSGTFTEAAEPNTTLSLDFYANTTPDATLDPNGVSGYGQGQTYLGSRTVYTDGSGSASFTADLAVGNLAGQWISATATDQNGNTSEFSKDIQATSAPSQTFAQNLAASLPQSSVGNVMTVQADTNTISDVMNGLSSLASTGTPVSFNLNLAPGKYSGQTVSVPTWMTLYINGTPNNQLPTNFDPAQPAFTLLSGNVVVSNVTFTSTGTAPAVVVSGGNLSLRHDIVQGPPTGTNAAIAVTGGTLDLGTTASPGNNTISVSASGQLVQNMTPNPISAVGNTFETGGIVLSAPTLSFTNLTSLVNPSTLNQTVTLTVTVRPDGSSTTPSGSVDFFDTTTKTDLGNVPLSSGSAALSTSALAAGNHVIRASYSGDSTFLPSLAILTQQVHYAFSGFLAPLNQGLAFAAGRTVPIKFQLTDYNKNFINSLSAVTALQVIYPDSSSHAVSGLRYDSIANQFIANWTTKGLAAGSYTISLSLLDGTNYTVPITIAAGPSSAALTTTSAGGTGSAPGGLLGGDIDLYVDNTNGSLTPDELARIQDGVTAVAGVTAPYGVAVMEVSDPTQADVTLNMNTTSAVGGYVNGVLGCTTDAGQITIIAGWNFYSGSDATQIGSAQYDFETVVVHELGHALGLGHSTNSTSVMFVTLNLGTANRALTVADLNVPDSETGGACGLHAASTRTEVMDFSLATASGFGVAIGGSEGSDGFAPSNSHQTGLNAALSDWPFASAFPDSSGHLLKDTHSFLSRLAQSNNEQDEFWSSIAGSSLLDKVFDLTGHLAM
jgi:hypothetical protein